MSSDDLTNQQIFAMIKELDEDKDVEVSEWEANFIESVLELKEHRRPLSERQRDTALKILRKYGMA